MIPFGFHCDCLVISIVMFFTTPAGAMTRANLIWNFGGRALHVRCLRSISSGRGRNVESSVGESAHLCAAFSGRPQACRRGRSSPRNAPPRDTNDYACCNRKAAKTQLPRPKPLRFPRSRRSMRQRAFRKQATRKRPSTTQTHAT